MRERVDPAEQAVPMRTRRRLLVAALSAGAVVVAIGGFFVARSLWWSLRPTPDFSSLAVEPDDALEGTVAFIRPYPSSDCIWVVAAAGGEPEQVACIEGGAGDLAWLPGGRLQSTRYEGGEGTSETGSWIIDVASGEVTVVASDEIPPRAEPSATVRGPGGEEVSTASERGRLTVTMTTDGETRTLLSVAAPDTYTLGQPAWSPDGDWFVVKDDLDRLLLVTTAEDSTTRILVEGAYGQVVTSEQLVGGNGE